MGSNCFCRICAVKSDNYIKIFDAEGQALKLAEKIHKCLQIWLSPDDFLPKAICMNCCEKIEEYSEFFNLCSSSQISLRKTFGQEILDEFRDSDESVNKNENDSKNEDSSAAERTDGSPNLEIRNGGGRLENLPLENQPVDCDSESAEQSHKTNRVLRQKSRKFINAFDDKNAFNEKSTKSTRRVFQNYIWGCTECCEEMQTLSSLKVHYLEVHDRPPNFKCMTCSKVYDRYRSFTRHVKMHKDPKRFSCNICGKQFSQKTVLQSHTTVHSEDRPHVCSQCGKAFKQFSSLYLHYKCHLPEQAKPKFPCNICQKVLSSKHIMEIHMRIHTGEKNFICDICGKGFIAKSSLDYHILAHSDSKPHSCLECGKGFRTTRLLAKHSSLHTGVKPHQCDVCGKQFRERSALKEHNRIHTGVMPYSCEYCGKTFRFKGILTVHLRQHTGERPYNCIECGKEFTNWGNYNKHMKRRHKEVAASHQPDLNRETVSESNIQPLNNNSLVEFHDPTPTSAYKNTADSEIYSVSQYHQPIQMGSVPYYVHPFQPIPPNSVASKN